MNTPTASANAEIRATWHALSAEETLEQLEVPSYHGLSSEEAARRLKQYGANRLVEKPRPGFFRLVLNQLNSFIVILLIVAALISAFLGEWVEAGAIFAIVLLNAVLGVVQESRAEEALAALKKLAAPEAQVIRDGRRVSIPAEELVPGDIVLLEAGNFVPADMRLLEAVNLRIEEAALTGESLPVTKNAALVLEEDVPLGERKNTACMGTTVAYGRGRGVVISTGDAHPIGNDCRHAAKHGGREHPPAEAVGKSGQDAGLGSAGDLRAGLCGRSGAHGGDQLAGSDRDVHDCR